MAGSEKRGIEFARADLFDGAVCITTPTPNTDPSALMSVEEFWKTLGMKIHRCSPEEHDALVGWVSHLPHAVAAALVRIQSSASLGLAGRGFLDATRIAAGDPGLWRDILLDNRENVLRSIEQLQAELSKFSGMLDPSKASELQAWLSAAAAARENLG
jgi:prephenate dehydrogenase